MTHVHVTVKGGRLDKRGNGLLITLTRLRCLKVDFSKGWSARALGKSRWKVSLEPCTKDNFMGGGALKGSTPPPVLHPFLD